MMQIFLAGGPVMYPLLLCSVIALAVIIERSLFWLAVARHRQPEMVTRLVQADLDDPGASGASLKDLVAQVLVAGRRGPRMRASLRMQMAAHAVLSRLTRNLAVLSTLVSLAPLLGIFGTVLGIIQSFKLMGGAQLAEPGAASIGLAQALITTAFGLAIAMPSLIAFKFFHLKALKLQHDIEERCTELEHALGIVHSHADGAITPSPSEP